MDGESFREAIEAEKRTELDRIGSEKLLVALTDATLERETVLGVAANAEYAAAETFRQWVDDEQAEPACDAFQTVADQEQDHYERVIAHLDAHEPPDAGGPLHSYLRGLEGTVERIGAGLVGRPLVSERSHTQVISFFVNEPDEELADLFRDLKTETREELSCGQSLLEEYCETEEDWNRARATAGYAIQVAYDDYADSLRGMGLDPKPLC